MKPVYLLAIGCLALHAPLAGAEATDVCPAVFEKAELEKESVPAEQSLRRVVGAGRLHFHTAPDRQCELKDVFVVPNDRVEAYAEHGDYTEVIYWNAKSRIGTAGWVVTSRLAEIGATSGPGAAPTVISSALLR